jgi:hypothetical protein
MRGFLLMALLPALASAADFFDPTRPVQAPAAQSAAKENGAQPQVGVAMVVTAKEGVMALRDGRILRVGSRTDEGVVVRISADAVYVRTPKGQEQRLPLYPEVSVSPAASRTGNGERSIRK